MLYESDLNTLLTQWEVRLDKQSSDYKDCLRDCIYDLKSLIDRNFADELLASEAFEQQLAEDERDWEAYFNNLLTDGIFA